MTAPPVWHLAQINIGRLVAPADDSQVAGFFAELDRINALAESSDGFVWRLKGEGNNATDLQPKPDDPLFAINMSVWTDIDSLAGFVYRTAHREVMRRRREWFAHLRDPYAVVWWVAAGVRPTITDAEERLASLREHGPTPYAFTVRRPFPPPGSSAAEPSADNWFCPA